MERGVVVRRLIAAVVIAGALVFAIEGGEFSTIDLFRQRQTRARLTGQIEALQRLVDSLQRYENKLRTDPATQERIAREVFGMVRSGEVLYRFYDPAKTDSVKR